MPNPRKYPQRPIVAVSGVILNPTKEILIVRRAKSPGKGLWSLPGGAVKIGEKLHNALIREIKEECNISIKIEKFLGAFDRIFFDENQNVQYHYVVLDYLCHTKDTEIQPASDIDDYIWISSETISEYSYTPGVKDFLIDGFNKNCFR